MVLEKKTEQALKELKTLNLMDRFLFAEAMEDAEIFEIILEIILGRDIVLQHKPQAEKEIRRAFWSKIVRLDVMGVDVERSVYNAEVQKRNTGNIPRRSRYYNSMIDSKLLTAGSIDYNALSDVFVITIMSFDLFGEGLYRYTYEMTCNEIPGLKLADGAKRIFLNTRGCIDADVDQDLVDLLRYFESTTYKTALDLDNEKIWRLHQKIDAIKMSEEIGVKWMNAWEEKIYNKLEARAEGLAEGRAEGRAEAVLEDIKNVMDSLELTQEQAMDVLKIPEADRAGYAERLK